MQSLDLGEKEVLSVKFGEASYDVAFPNVRQIKAFQDKVSSAEKNNVNAAEILLDFLMELGLPHSVAEQMSIGQLGKLAEVISGSKKN